MAQRHVGGEWSIGNNGDYFRAEKTVTGGGMQGLQAGEQGVDITLLDQPEGHIQATRLDLDS